MNWNRMAEIEPSLRDVEPKVDTEPEANESIDEWPETTAESG